MNRRLIGIAIASSLSAGSLAAQGIGDVTVHGSVAEIEIELAGGIAAQLRLEFDSVAGLSAANLGLSAELVSPTNLPLLVRLPAGFGAIPTGFPVLWRIEPPVLGGLAFSNCVAIELHTENLEYVTGTPLRLLAAPANGAFTDITSSLGAGSYRARGDRGSFSEFLIASDLRSASEVVTAKLDALDARLGAHSAAMGSTLAEQLEELAAEVRAAAENSDPGAAIELLDDWLELVEQGAGDEIPNRWRAARDLTNAAGELLAAGRTLRFSLALGVGGS